MINKLKNKITYKCIKHLKQYSGLKKLYKKLVVKRFYNVLNKGI